jgi:hypothetical protein
MEFPMFIRVYRHREDKEILINVNSIWKIEVTYAVPNGSGKFFSTGLKHGIESPEARRMYKVFFGSDESTITGDLDDSVIKVLEQIYKEAIMGSGHKDTGGE